MATPVRRVDVQLAEQLDDIAIRIGDVPLLDVVSPVNSKSDTYNATW